MATSQEKRSSDIAAGFIHQAIRLARRAYGATAPNPLVGAILLKRGEIIGRGWHRRAGGPHAEIEAIQDALSQDRDPKDSTLYVTLEPCSTYGRTPPCTKAIVEARIRKVIIGAIDPNPAHSGRGLAILRSAGIQVEKGVLTAECERMNEAFNYWVLEHTPFVTIKAAMTLDGKIATENGDSRWITGEKARTHGMHLRQGAGAILVGINTILADNPALTLRGRGARIRSHHPLRRIILDTRARIPLTAHVVSDGAKALTTVVVGKEAPAKRIRALSGHVQVLRAPDGPTDLRLRWLLRHLGSEGVTSLLVEGGGEVNASFLLSGLAQRIAFFYAPKILGGRRARKAVSGVGVQSVPEGLGLSQVEWRRLGEDLFLTARVDPQRRIQPLAELGGDQG